MAVVGDIIEGTVTSVMPFGAFISWGARESGLVHISELSGEYVKDIDSFIKKGDAVSAKVIGIGENGKVSLSIKQVQQPKRGRVKTERPHQQSARPDAFEWTAKNTEELSFEDKLSKFKHESEEKIRDSRRRMENKRSGGYSRRGY